MVSNDSYNRLIVDASPLIYLAKLDALDVFRVDDSAAVTEGVRNEVLLPQAAYRFPEIVRIDDSIRNRRLDVVSLSDGERAGAEGLSRQLPGLGRGELETIAVARARRCSAVMTDRRASRVARILGVPVVGIVELLFTRTTELDRLASRVRGLARLTNMRIETLEQLLDRAHRGRT